MSLVETIKERWSDWRDEDQKLAAAAQAEAEAKERQFWQEREQWKELQESPELKLARKKSSDEQWARYNSPTRQRRAQELRPIIAGIQAQIDELQAQSRIEQEQEARAARQRVLSKYRPQIEKLIASIPTVD